MAVTGIVKIMKWVLIVLNIPILCAGAIAIGLGGWGLGSEYGAEKLRDITGSELYRGAAIAIIIGGSFLVAISLIGILGAFLENRWLLGTYFVIMLLLLILFVTSAAVGFAYRDKLKEDLIRQMENSLKNQYMNNINENDDNYRATNVWDDIQKKLDCCGVEGELGSTKSWYIYQSNSEFRRQSGDNLVPASCCVSEKPDAACQKQNLMLNMPPQPDPNVTQDNPALNEKGCFTQVEDYIFNRIVAIGGISIAILIVMFFCLLLSVCVCTHIGKSKGDDM